MIYEAITGLFIWLFSSGEGASILSGAAGGLTPLVISSWLSSILANTLDREMDLVAGYALPGLAIAALAGATVGMILRRHAADLEGHGLALAGASYAAGFVAWLVGAGLVIVVRG